MTIRDKAVKGYLRKIRRLIPCGSKAKKQIMESISQSVENYLEENPQADWAAFQAHFGTPEEITAAYIDGMETEEIICKFKKKKIIIGVVVGAVILALLIWLVAVVSAWWLANKETTGNYYEVEIIETTEETK